MTAFICDEKLLAQKYIFTFYITFLKLYSEIFTLKLGWVMLGWKVDPNRDLAGAA